MRNPIFLLLAAAFCASPAIAGDNAELARIYEADQTARQHETIDWEQVSKDDSARRDQVRSILAAGGLRTSIDYFHAAMVFQHGDRLSDYRLAHALASIASELDPGNRPAAWLVAATFDRMLMNRLAAQWYGTQFYSDAQGLFLYPVEEAAATDEERRTMNVPSLAESRERAAEMAAESGIPLRNPAPTIEQLRAERAASLRSPTP